MATPLNLRVIDNFRFSVHLFNENTDIVSFPFKLSLNSLQRSLCALALIFRLIQKVSCHSHFCRDTGYSEVGIFHLLCWPTFRRRVEQSGAGPRHEVPNPRRLLFPIVYSTFERSLLIPRGTRLGWARNSRQGWRSVSARVASGTGFFLAAIPLSFLGGPFLSWRENVSLREVPLYGESALQQTDPAASWLTSCVPWGDVCLSAAVRACGVRKDRFQYLM